MEVQFSTHFSMLTEHLHILFKRYIIDGRMRAPPEFELRDLIPTFQRGAKTHRRALQSKFKSWAKRMTILNGNLVLSSSGKIIIPQERCEEIVMELHRDNHMSINKVITQIQRKYSWTKKNFGMDIETVMNAISNNCKNAACQKELRKVAKTYFKKIHWFPASKVSRQFYQDSCVKYAGFYNSKEIPPRVGISSAEYPILQSYLSNRDTTLEALPERVKNQMNPLTKLNNNENYKNIVLPKDYKHFTELSEEKAIKHESVKSMVDISRKCNAPQSATSIENQRNTYEAPWSTLNSGKKQYFSKLLDTWDENEYEKVTFLSPLSVPPAALPKSSHSFTMENGNSSRNSYSFMRSCKKPRNSHDFKKQLKDAEMFPEIYPGIFTDPKTQFLSVLDLVPKRICSKRILTKFSKEHRKKSLMEKRRSWFTGEHKVLRDRNKLNKRNSHRLKMKHEAYGSFSKSHSSTFYHSSSRNSQKIRNDNFKKLKNTAKRPLRGHIENPRMIKPKFILPKKSPETVTKDPEIIDIASSDDESPVFQNCNDAKSEVSESLIQPASSCNQTSASQYADLSLFGFNAENEEAVRNQMFYAQNFGYNGLLGAPNLFFGQNVVNFPVTSSNPSYQLNDSFYIDSQTQFPILRPFLIPALSNNDISVLQAGNFPMVRPLKPISSPNISPYFKNLQPLPKSTNSFSGQSENPVDGEKCSFVSNGNVAEANKESSINSKSTNSFSGQSENSVHDEQCSFAFNRNVAEENKESSTNSNPVPHQASQPTPDLKIFLVNKTPKKTYLIVPPNCKTYLNTAKRIIPILNRKQPIAPRINATEKMPFKYKTVAKELQSRRLKNALFPNVNYSGKQKELKKDIQSEMARLSNWISKVKSSVTTSNFHRGVEKFSHRLTNQLNVGITLVKSVRNTLIEIEENGENFARDAV